MLAIFRLWFNLQSGYTRCVGWRWPTYKAETCSCIPTVLLGEIYLCSTVRVIQNILCYWTNTTGMTHLKRIVKFVALLFFFLLGVILLLVRSPFKFKRKILTGKTKSQFTLWRHIEEVEVQLHSFLSSAIDGVEYSTSIPGRLTYGAHWNRGWVNPEPVRTSWRRDTSLTLVRTRTQNLLACSLVTMVTALSWLRIFKSFRLFFDFHK